MLVDGVARPKSHRLAAGSVVAFPEPAPSEIDLEPADIDVDVVWEDEHLMIVDKPAGLVVHPAPGTTGPTLVHALLGRVGGGEKARPGIVHRLDRDTSGLLVVARDDRTLGKLQGMLRRRRIERTYTALVRGRPRSWRGAIEAPIGRDRRHPTRISLDTDHPRDAVTHFEVAELLERYALLEVRLETGRTHQIRVHLEAIGLPVVGRSDIRPRARAGAGAAVPARVGAEPGPPLDGRAAHALARPCPMTSPALCNAPGDSPLRYTPHVLYPSATPGDTRRPAVPMRAAGVPATAPGEDNRTDSKEDMRMSAVTMRELLEAGVHFGHQTRRWNPKMRRYIFGERGGIYIIDLQQSIELLQTAHDYVRNISERGGTVLFVGTKKQCAGRGRGAGQPRRHAVRQPPLAGRAADQLPDDPGADRQPARAAPPEDRGPARAAAAQGAAGDALRAGEAGDQPRRDGGHASGCPTP